MSNLPPYVAINDENIDKNKREMLITPSETIQFPLSEENLEIIKILETKFDNEDNCVGLAAPQIGFHKRIIVFAVNASEELRKWRPDLTEGMPKTIWINPEYQGIGEEKSEDYEGCFSVNNMAGTVKRYTSIRYSAFLPNGEKIEGTANGFLARVIQHEIDHTQGILYIHKANEGSVMTIEEYREKRKKAMEGDN
ncbi:MAG: peptide deformylase [Sphingobacteriia bacterium]|nr:peptide deformylase [Sphingobacteriia bacterium]